MKTLLEDKSLLKKDVSTEHTKLKSMFNWIKLQFYFNVLHLYFRFFQ